MLSGEMLSWSLVGVKGLKKSFQDPLVSETTTKIRFLCIFVAKNIKLALENHVPIS